MSNQITYHDSLVCIADDIIEIKKYYFPIPFSKKIRIDQIQSIEIIKPELLNGKFRIWGSGDLKTWYALDIKRPKRENIFIITIKEKQNKIGFTVEDSEKAIQILNQYNLIKQKAA
jgi:hypothetical protein